MKLLTLFLFALTSFIAPRTAVEPATEPAGETARATACASIEICPCPEWLCRLLCRLGVCDDCRDDCCDDGGRCDRD